MIIHCFSRVQCSRRAVVSDTQITLAGDMQKYYGDNAEEKRTSEPGQHESQHAAVQKQHSQELPCNPADLIQNPDSFP